MNWSIGREHSLQVKHFLWYTCLMEIIFSASKTLPLHLGQALLSSSPAWTVQVSNCAPSKNLGFELPLNRKIIFCVFQHILLISLGTWGILAWLFCLWKKRREIFTEVCRSKRDSKFCHRVRRKLMWNPKAGCRGCNESSDDGTIQKLPPFFPRQKLFHCSGGTLICPPLLP